MANGVMACSKCDSQSVMMENKTCGGEYQHSVIIQPSRAKTPHGMWTEANNLSNVQHGLFLIYVQSVIFRNVPVLYLNLFTLPGFTQSADDVFHLVVVLCEAEYDIQV